VFNNAKSKTEVETILVVDDEPTSCYLISTLLSLYDFNAVQANNGRDALEIMGNQAIDLVLLDIMMPEMDGFEVCRRLKADVSTRDIPVVFVSALFDEESRVKGFAVGAEGFVSKPFMTVELIQEINNLKHEHERPALFMPVKLEASYAI
jgi:CheY-like chemotaxis protein